MSLIDLKALQDEAAKNARDTGTVLLGGVDCGGFGTGEIARMTIGRGDRAREITFARVGQQRIPLMAALAIADAYNAAIAEPEPAKPEPKPAPKK